MAPRTHLPYELHRLEFQILAGEFRRGALSEAGFRHHLCRLRFNPSEIEAEVAHHRTEMSARKREAA